MEPEDIRAEKNRSIYLDGEKVGITQEEERGFILFERKKGRDLGIKSMDRYYRKDDVYDKGKHEMRIAEQRGIRRNDHRDSGEQLGLDRKSSRTGK